MRNKCYLIILIVIIIFSIICIFNCQSASNNTDNNTTATNPDTYKYFLYAANQNSYTITRYLINENTGALTPDATIDLAGKACLYLAADKTQKHIYAEINGNIRVYSINTNGDLTQVGSDIPTGGTYQLMGSSDMAITSKYLYISNYGGTPNVNGYSINTDGTLTVLPGFPFQLDNSVLIRPGAIISDPSGNHLYIAESYKDSGTLMIRLYNIQTDGSLIQDLDGSADAYKVSSIVIDPDDKYLYANCNSGNNLYKFNIASDGKLTKVTPDSNTMGYSMSLVMSGRFLYNATMANNLIYAFLRNTSDVNLDNIGPYIITGANLNLAALALAVDGKFIYSANRVTDDVTENINGFQINQSNGKLTDLIIHLHSGKWTQSMISIKVKQ